MGNNQCLPLNILDSLYCLFLEGLDLGWDRLHSRTFLVGSGLSGYQHYAHHPEDYLIFHLAQGQRSNYCLGKSRLIFNPISCVTWNRLVHLWQLYHLEARSDIRLPSLQKRRGILLVCHGLDHLWLHIHVMFPFHDFSGNCNLLLLQNQLNTNRRRSIAFFN